MDARDWLLEIETQLLGIAPLISIVKSFVYMPAMVVNPQDRPLIEGIEKATGIRLAPCDRVFVFAGDVQFTIDKLDDELLVRTNGVIYLHSATGKDVDCTLAYDWVQNEVMHEYKQDDQTFPSPDIRFAFLRRYDGYEAETRPGIPAGWLIFCQSNWIGSTSARCFTYYLMDERRFRFINE